MQYLIRPIFEKAPHVLFYEGAHGTTPLELATEKQLYKTLGGHNLSKYTYWKPHVSPLVYQGIFEFDARYNGSTWTRDDYESWEISQEMAHSMKSRQYPRKLITHTELKEIAQLYV